MTDGPTRSAPDETGRADEGTSRSDERRPARPIGGESPTFEAPWQARAFAVAVALSDRYEGTYDWSEFRGNLVEEIEGVGSAEPNEGSIDGIDASESAYYEQWLRALERVTLEAELIDGEAIRDRVREFAAGERDASEFVEDEDDHAHPHADDGHRDHDHGHGTD